jgi:two-component system OmpR family sensor kinase
MTSSTERDRPDFAPPGPEPLIAGPGAAKGAPHAAETPPAITRPLARGTLGRQLVVRVTALVAVVAVLLSCATALATRQLLIVQVDHQLRDVATRLFRGGPGGAPGGGGLLSPGQPIDTVYATYDQDGHPLGGERLLEHGRLALSDDIVNALSHVPADAARHTMELPELGHYRVAEYGLTTFDRRVVGSVVVGISIAPIDHLMVQLIGLEVVLSLIAVAFTVLAARTLVERSLRPLTRVAATAQQVSRLELDRGEVALAVRVPAKDTDPASEVGRVGLAINHMLNNVAGALAARQASETKVRQFVADASHELRNPLAAIRGYAELTQRTGEELPADASYAISRVESEAERMSRLVDDLLLLARLDSRPDLDLAPTDLTEIALNAVSDARAAGPDHIWTLALPEEPIEALGDRHRLHQVVANLLANARTHTPPGTSVETGLTVQEGQAVLTVTDNGPGIPPEVREHVFERFSRADTSRVRAAGAERGTSTGLGLAIVAAVVEAHRGRVFVDSHPGLTRFVVILPLARSSQPQPALAPATGGNA